jgi:hypothetical protein
MRKPIWHLRGKVSVQGLKDIAMRGNVQGFLFFGEFSALGDKEKGLANPTKGFLRIQKKNRHIWRKKRLEVARFRQCVPLGCKNYAGSQKNLPVPRIVIIYC